MGEWQNELGSIQRDAAQLADDALHHTREASELRADLAALEERIADIEEALEEAPEEDFERIQGVANDIERNLIFVREMTKTPKTDPESEAHSINGEAYNLAVALIEGTKTADEARAQAERLSADLRELLAVKSESFDVQRLLAEAAQELRFVEQGGKGTTTSRIAQVMRDHAAE